MPIPSSPRPVKPRPRWRLLPALAFLATGALASSGQAAGPGGERRAGLVYARVDGRDLQLDLYLPEAANPRARLSPRPVIVFLHPGGWRSGGRDQVKLVPGLVGATGCAVASIEFRQSGRAVFPAQIFDCKAAVRFLRAHATDYGLDPRRVGVVGFSSGGHLAALLGTSGGVPALEDPAEGNPAQSSRVQAVCDVSGPTDFARSPDALLGKFSEYGLFGGSPEEKPDLARAADPTTYIRGGEPPFLILHGDHDPFVPLADSRRLARALRARGDAVKFVVVQGAGHIPHQAQQQRDLAEFFVRYLHPGTP